MPKNCLLLVILFTLPLLSNAQADSTLQNLENLPAKYFTQLDSKIDKYSSRITKKTTNTLEKLARWETKIKSLLDKTSPETSAQLFGEGRMTFNKLLQQMQSGQQTMLQYQNFYDKYRDDLTTSLKYVEQQKQYVNEKVLAKAKQAKEKMQELNAVSDSTEAIQQFIKERKKELINTAFQYLGKNKYLSKINKEAWYYAETMRSYKEIFSDEKKMEQTAKMILNQIPAFQSFLQKNSLLASMFGAPGDAASIADLSGLQTRASIQSLIQQRIASGGPNAQQVVSQNLQAAQAQLDQLKTKLINSATGGGNDIPAFDFTPNTQKTKTLKQRFEFGTNIQFAKSNILMPTTMDMVLTVGYKLSDKSVIGVGGGYKLGMGTITNIKFTGEGLNLRSFLDWKLKRQIFITGGMEMNYLSNLPGGSASFPPLGDRGERAWQQSALLGLTKKIKIKTKWAKETKLQFLYDFLSRQHAPVSQPILFRVGYNF